MYNSDVDRNREEEDATMIDQSYLYGDNDGPTSNSIIRRVQRANHCAKNTAHVDDRHDFIYVEHDQSEEAGRQIERILNSYRQDLVDQSNTQLDCDQKLIIRLLDLLRSIFTTNEKKLQSLENLYEEIANQQDIRFIAQNEKTEQLTSELSQLQNMMITVATNERPVARSNSVVSYEQWVEMEEESKNLHDLVEAQQSKINELIKLILPEDQVSPNEQRSTASSAMRETPASTDRPSGTVQNNNNSLPPSDTFDDCPYCKYKFPPTTTRLEFVEHMGTCVFTSSRSPLKSQNNTCPYCQADIPGTDEVYIEHASRCLNDQPDL